MSVRSVRRALSVFDLFQPGKQQWTLHDISESLGLAKSTTFRILQTLVDAGYLIQTNGMYYSLSLKVLRLGNSILPNMGVREIARPEMQRVNMATNETVALSEFLPSERVIIDVIESTQPLKFVLRPGESVPRDMGATGKLYLAHHPDVLDAYLKKNKTERDQILEQIKHIHENGYSITTGTRMPGSVGVAVAIFDMHDDCKYSIGVYGPDVRVKSNLEIIVKSLKDSANLISARLGSSVALP